MIASLFQRIPYFYGEHRINILKLLAGMLIYSGKTIFDCISEKYNCDDVINVLLDCLTSLASFLDEKEAVLLFINAGINGMSDPDLFTFRKKYNLDLIILLCQRNLNSELQIQIDTYKTISGRDNNPTKLEVFNSEIKFKSLELKDWLAEIFNIPAKELSVLEFWDFDFDSLQKIANGCSGVVCEINIKVDEFEKRTCTTCLISKLAIKMMFNFAQDNQTTIFQKQKFDKEYIFPLANPHWSHVKLFNYFRGRTADDLIDEKDIDFYASETTYFTMELCKSNLENYIKENKNKISVLSALSMIYQILNGIKHLYDHKVVHLDLKANNIFIADRKKIKGTQVVIGDFGTTHPFIYEEDCEGNIVNRSPELLKFQKGHPVDIRKNDVWATGCIFFEILEGKHPFYDIKNTNFNICTGRLPLAEFDKHGEGTKQFLKLLWNRDPNKRLDPTSALVICAFLLWGAPCEENAGKFTEYSPEELQTNFKLFCTSTCKNFSESSCKMWLNQKINELHTKFSQIQDDDKFDIEFVLQINFVITISPCEVLDCTKTLSTIYD